MLKPGTVVTLDCDAHRPRRQCVVLYVNEHLAWLVEVDARATEPSWCIGVNAGHQLVDDQQRALW